MKASFLLLLILFPVFFSCQEEGIYTSHQSVIGSDGIAPESLQVYRTTFIATPGISGNGTAEIYLEGNQHKLILKDYTIEDGPDLKVYLSKSNTPNSFINLGGVFSDKIYAIPEDISFSEYKYVLIHCQQYNHLFAFGELQPY